MSRRNKRPSNIPNPNRPKAVAVCQACRFKANSEKALKSRREVDSSIVTPYSGQMTGVFEGNVIVATFDNDVQVGFIAVPAVHVFTVTEQMNIAARNAIQQMANEAAASINTLGNEGDEPGEQIRQMHAQVVEDHAVDAADADDVFADFDQ